MSIALEDQRNIVTVHDGETITVQSYSPGTIAAGLQLNAALSGSVLRRVRDNVGTNTPLHLAEDAVVVDGAALTVDSVQFDVDADVSVGVGETAWNAIDGTLNLGMKGGVVVLQMGEELLVPVINNSGGGIANGMAVYIDGASGDFPTIDLAQADDKMTALFFGVTTEAIGSGATGFVNIGGKVRGMDTSAIAAGGTAFLSNTIPGCLRPTPVTSPDYKARVGICIVSDVSNGILLVQPSVVPLLKSLSDVTITAPQDNEILVYNAGVGIFENKTPLVTTASIMPIYIDKPARGKELSIGGGMQKILDVGSVSSGSPDSGINGCGKLLFNIVAGSDLNGSITITGDTIDRSTGVLTVADTEVITIAGATTDNSNADAEGNLRHAFISAYLTSKWFQGAFIVSTTDVDISDFDVWNIAFHQFGDVPTSVELFVFDINCLAINTSAWLYSYLYSVEVTDGTCNITREASLEIPGSAIDAADAHYRRKIDDIGKVLDPSTDGVWVDVFPGPFNQTYWEDITGFLISLVTSPVTLS
jgi:hypothetical protein